MTETSGRPVPNICTAPFTSVLIDVNKNIKPCNQYAEGPLVDAFKRPVRDKLTLGNLHDSSLVDILNSQNYKDLRKQMYNDIPPKGCEYCIQREAETGFNQRQSFMPAGSATTSIDGATSYNGRSYSDNWQKGITTLEIDTSNICNLTCLGCDSFFSSAWTRIEDSIEVNDNTRFYMSKKLYRNVPHCNPIADKLIKELSNVNLSYLERVVYKGGEPFLNKDMLLSLTHFDRIGVLSNLIINLTTNGTVINKDIIGLLKKAKRVEIVLSVDGTDDLNRYIRYSNAEVSTASNMIEFCNQFTGSTNSVIISMMPTIMVYNVFSLDKLLNRWLLDVVPLYMHDDNLEVSPSFHSSHFLRNKPWLTLRALQPDTIAHLIAYYEKQFKNDLYKQCNTGSFIKSDANPFSNLIAVLKRTEYGGDILHDQMVKYIRDLDKVTNQRILHVVPEMKNEMAYLTICKENDYQPQLWPDPPKKLIKQYINKLLTLCRFR